VAAITYETVFIAEPEIPTDRVDQIITKIKETVAAHQGSVTSEDRWGKRRLAYPLRGHREGFYTVLSFTAEPTVVAALEHFYNVTDAVIRQMTIRHVVSKKKFAPRRERPAGAPSRMGSGGPRSRSDGPRHSTTPPPAAAAAPSAPAANATPAPASEAAPQGDK
jgi:small subunit ribosomal protein S6